MRVEELLNSHYDSMNENEKYICHYLTGHYRECAGSTISEFARHCSVSTTMLVRFCQASGAVWLRGTESTAEDRAGGEDRFRRRAYGEGDKKLSQDDG